MSIITKHLDGVSAQKTQEFLDSFDIVLSDCDGVLWDFVSRVDGAVESLKRLQDLGKRVYFVTNNSVVTANHYCSKIRKLGFDVKAEQLINPAKAICWYLKRINFNEKIFALASAAFRETLANAGFNLAPPSPPTVETDVAATLHAVVDEKSIKAVIVDVDMYCGWPKMAFAVSCLQRKDCMYFCGALDEWVIYDSNTKILGPGPLLNVITKQSGRTPVEFGKPSEVLRDYVFEELKIENPSRCLFIGDTVNQDMKFGTLCGFRKLFVGTGCDRLEDTQGTQEATPHYYLSSLGELNPLLDSLKCPKNTRS